MTTSILWRWEQDGSGGDHGRATYFPGSVYETTVTLLTFAEANALYNAISASLTNARCDARAGLLAQIGRIEA